MAAVALLALASLSCVSAAPLPHIVFNLIDDWGHANVGYHRVKADPEVLTPNIDALVADGVQLDRHYVHQFCSPTRSSVQSGRLPVHVNVVNADMSVHNPADPISGFAGIPRNMTGIATKLKSAGYATHQAGKWDAGMATPGRGYDTSMLYFHHANDYWTSIDDTLCKVHGKRNTSIVDLWLNDGPAIGHNNSWLCSQTMQTGCVYEDEIFGQQVLDVIAKHDPTTPFFLFWSPHIVHAPLEVPTEYLNKFNFMTNDLPKLQRQYYAAMVNYVDTLIGQVVAALKAKGMWDTLLWISSADNGGPIYQSGAAGANNFPLRGGKMSNWEGGIRVNAYASGGFLPPAVRGTINEGLMTISDWYTTFCALAGVDHTDTRAAAAGLPAVDGLNLWPLLSGANATSPRTEVPIGGGDDANLHKNGTVVSALLRADGWKLIIGELAENIWQGPTYPNASTNWPETPYHCGVPSNPPVGKGGCLFNVFTDPTEHDDVAAANPKIVQELYARIEELQLGVFNPNRGTDDGAACDAAVNQWSGFWGPFLP